MAQTKTNTSRKSKIEKVTKTIVGLSECDHFLNWNDCSSVTYGILAPLLRKTFSDNTLTDVFDHFEKQNNGHFSADDLIENLIRRRNKLPKTDISFSRRSLINRLIFHIRQDSNDVQQNIAVYRLQLKQRMINEREVSTNFSRFEKDLRTRRKIIETSRLFHVAWTETQNTPHILTLIDQTTFLLKNTTKRDEGLRIIENSFVIVCQPHFNGIPVTIYQSTPPTGLYMVKIHVRILSLLSSFMRTDFNSIKLNEIDVDLVPSSSGYHIENGQKISWKTASLNFDSNSQNRTIDFAETDVMTIRLTSREKSGVPFARVPQKFKFGISLQFQNESYKVTLESMPFIIGNHNVQIPELLSGIIWTDLQSILPSHQFNLNWIRHFLQRYFLNRTGVLPNQCIVEYLQSLPKSMTEEEMTNLHANSQRIRSGLIVPFVSHVELFVKNPLLSLFYVDGLFLSPCDSIESMRPEDSPILRSNRIEPSTNSTSWRTEITLDTYQYGQWSRQDFDTKKLSRPLVSLIERQSHSDHRYNRYFDEKLTEMLQSNRDFHPMSVTDITDVDDSPDTNSSVTNEFMQYFPESARTDEFNLGNASIADYQLDDNRIGFDDVVFPTENHLNQSCFDLSMDMTNHL